MSDFIRKRGERYYPMIYLGYIQGKRKYKSGGGFDSRREAKDELLKMQNMKNNNSVLLDAKDMLFKDVAEQWYELHAKQIYSTRTLERYEGILKNSITPIFSNVKISALEPLHIQRFLMTLKSAAPASVRKIYYVLKSILDKAVEWKIIEESPCKGITLPTVKEIEFSVWDSLQIQDFLKIIKDTKWYIPFLIAFTTGMRQGEICGLKWSDFNENQGELSVVRSMLRDGTLKDTKTKSSKRKIVLLQKTLDVLKSQKEFLLENNKYKKNSFITIHDDGEPIRPENLGKTFQKFIDANNLEKIRFHDIRHTFATTLLKNGTNPKIVSEILGHSDVQTTLNIYSHVLPDIQKDTMASLEKILF